MLAQVGVLVLTRPGELPCVERHPAYHKDPCLSLAAPSAYPRVPPEQYQVLLLSEACRATFMYSANLPGHQLQRVNVSRRDTPGVVCPGIKPSLLQCWLRLWYDFYTKRNEPPRESRNTRGSPLSTAFKANRTDTSCLGKGRAVPFAHTLFGPLTLSHCYLGEGRSYAETWQPEELVVIDSPYGTLAIVQICSCACFTSCR